MMISDDIKEAHRLATQFRSKAYAPYSKFKVGSVLKLKNIDELVGGCNVENASFGGCICAERASVLSSISKFGKKPFEYILVITDLEEPVVPCAFCLQVLVEFDDGEMDIYIANLKEIKARYKLKELLPNPFRSFKP